MPALYTRDVVATALDAAADAKTAFSSPSQCLKYNICKIPLIIGCVVAGLILLSCICYWAACLRCMSCLCCGCCDSCANGSRSRRGARSRDYQPPMEMDYKPQPPPSYFSYAPNQQVGTTPLPVAKDRTSTSYHPITQPPPPPPQQQQSSAYRTSYHPANQSYYGDAPEYASYSGGQAQSYYTRQ